MRRRVVVPLTRLDCVGLRWRAPAVGRVLAIEAGSRRFEAGAGGFWVNADRLELVAPCEACWAIVEQE